MKKLWSRATFALLIVVALVGALVAPAVAVDYNNDIEWWLHVNSPGSYCGYSEAGNNNYGNNQTDIGGYGRVYVTNHNPCSPAAPGLPGGLPANYLRVKVQLHCLYDDGTDQIAWQSSDWKYNVAGDHGVEKDVPTPNFGASWCVVDQAGLYPYSRTVVTAQFYLYPTGWTTSYVNTTHWVTSGI